jgi:hypothetical protein
MVKNCATLSSGRTSRILLVLSLGAFTAALTEAVAQGTAEQRAACTPDAFRLCSSEIPDVARVLACMKAKRANLSAECRAAAFPSEKHRHELSRHRGNGSTEALRMGRQVITALGAPCPAQTNPAQSCNRRH